MEKDLILPVDIKTGRYFFVDIDGDCQRGDKCSLKEIGALIINWLFKA